MATGLHLHWPDHARAYSAPPGRDIVPARNATVPPSRRGACRQAVAQAAAQPSNRRHLRPARGHPGAEQIRTGQRRLAGVCIAAIPRHRRSKGANRRFAVPGTTILQRRLFLLEGVLAVGDLPCTGEIRSDPGRGVTVGRLQFGLLGRLQPVLLALDRARPDRLEAAFGSDAAAVRTMLNLPTVAAQVDWACSIFDRSGALPGAGERSSPRSRRCRTSKAPISHPPLPATAEPPPGPWRSASTRAGH
jgi:hypothetical protein